MKVIEGSAMGKISVMKLQMQLAWLEWWLALIILPQKC